MKNYRNSFILLIFLWTIGASCTHTNERRDWKINEYGYLETRGLNVLAFHNSYPVGKQGGIEIIHHGKRIATNGYIRMERVNGRRFPDPEKAQRVIDEENLEVISTVQYEDFDFSYSVSIQPENDNFRIRVDLDRPIPSEWENKLEFVLEFYPPLYYGKTYSLGETFGIIPIQANGPMINDKGAMDPESLGSGYTLTLAGEDQERKIIVESLSGELELSDERNFSGRGWLLLKSTIPKDISDKAVEWLIKPSLIPGWERDPMIAVSQVGYHPEQKKQAIIELEPISNNIEEANLFRIDAQGELKEILTRVPEKWGKFLRYNYVVFDFSEISESGMYLIKYDGQSSNPFSISPEVFQKDVWQPTLEAYFPVQMCHMEVRDRAAIWHGACHLDDALQAPLAIEHIDSYRQHEEAETVFLPMTTIPYLNRGGWHDAGDDDLAAGSQASTTYYLALSNEIASVLTDQTDIDFKNLKVRMRRPDGIPDMLQQIKHGVINLLSGYRSSGHSFAGIIANREGRNITGDWASQTDQLFYDQRLGLDQKTLTHSGVPDDRWAFTNRDTGLEYQVATALAAASRNLRNYDDELAIECLNTAIKVWDYEQVHEPVRQPNAYVPRNAKLEEIVATAELLYTTRDRKYLFRFVELLPEIKENMSRAAWVVARISDQINDQSFQNEFNEALKQYRTRLDSTLNSNPFGVPWRPRIWGVGWDIQRFALEHYFLAEKYPDLFEREIVLSVVNYVLGCHPGSNISLVSGVGANSVTMAFGVYRDWKNYIPGGMVSGTALIRPDYPELKETTPYLWQQSEYVMPGAGSYIFCILAADRLLND